MKKWRALTLQSLFFFSINSVLFLFFLDPLCYTLENWFPALSAGAPRFIPGFCGSVIALSAVCLFRATGRFWFSGHQGAERKMVGIVNAWSNKRLGSVFPGVRDSSSEMKKETSIKIATEGSSLDAPAPLTTFKVRKEKLGDKITALQLLVSPFGKADTASVLLEATRYIKFLNEQVTALSTPYMKVSLENSETREENALRSRGLCLVPVSTILKQENRILSEVEVCV